MSVLLALAVSAAHAQSCSCSVGGGDTALPSGPGPRFGGVMVTLNGTVNQTGGEGWDGFVSVDRQGNSMPGMAMPGHLAETARLGSTVGLPAGFSLGAVVPFTHSHPLYPSDMSADVDRSFFGDVALTSRWGHTSGAVFYGLSAGATLPTGPVVTAYDGGIRGGRGAVAASGGGQTVVTVSPHVDLGASVSGVFSLYPSPADDYTVGPAINGSLGAKFWPREKGRWQITAYLVAIDQGHDRAGDVVLDQTGVLAIAESTGFAYRLWSKRYQSATASLTGQAPLWQVSGDTWMDENWTLTGAFSLSL